MTDAEVLEIVNAILMGIAQVILVLPLIVSAAVHKALRGSQTLCLPS